MTNKLPEDNLQETEEVKAGEWVKCPHMPATPEFNKWFKEKFNCCPLTGKKLEEINKTPNPVNLENGEVNELKKALEEFVELGEKDPYAIYRDSTLGTTKTRYFEMFRYFTNIPKSKYDGIVGWIPTNLLSKNKSTAPAMKKLTIHDLKKDTSFMQNNANNQNKENFAR